MAKLKDDGREAHRFQRAGMPPFDAAHC